MARRLRLIDQVHFSALPIPARILYVLREQPNQTVQYGQLIRRVWGHGDDGYVRPTLRMHITFLRRGVRQNTKSVLLPGERIVTDQGVGYRLVVEEVQ